MNRRYLVALALAAAFGAHAQAPAPKVAVVSLVGDAITVTEYRGATGSNMGNRSTPIKMPGPLLDVAVLQEAEPAITRAAPGATVFPLKVPAAGSSTDPALVVVDGKVGADNVLVRALREQGFTHLLLATKHRSANIVSLSDGAISSGRGQLEGMGFFIDSTVRVQNRETGQVSEGILAPYLYIQLQLVDLAAMEVRATRAISANGVVTHGNSDTWNALTPAQKIEALQGLVKRNVGDAVGQLLGAR